MRLVSSQIGFCIDPGVIHVADHTGNRHPRLAFRWTNLYPFADGIAVRPVALGHLLVDDDDVGLAAGVALVKLATLKQRNAHRAKVVWQDTAITDARSFTGPKRSTLDR